MRMFRIAFGIAAALLVAGAAWADDVSRLAKAEELLQVSNTEAAMKQSVEKAREDQKKQAAKIELPDELKDQAAQLQEKFNQAIDSRLDWGKLRPAMIKVYADAFTEEEMDGIIAFYKSPAGKALLAKWDSLGPKAIAVMIDARRDSGADIRRIVDEAKKAQAQ
jgi:hypothetical protein